MIELPENRVTCSDCKHETLGPVRCDHYRQGQIDDCNDCGWDGEGCDMVANGEVAVCSCECHCSCTMGGY